MRDHWCFGSSVISFLLFGTAAFEKLFKGLKFFLFEVARGVGVDVHRGAEIWMAEDVTILSMFFQKNNH